MNEQNEDKNIDFEIRFCESLLEKGGNFIENLIALGDLYTKKGWHEKGLEIDKRLAQMRPEDPTILYNLACSYSLVHAMDKAFSAMKLAIDSGYDDLSYLEHDRDLANLLKEERFQNFLSELKDKRSVKKPYEKR